MNRQILAAWCATACALLAAAPASAALRAHGLFSEGAVLQRQAIVPVWGTTDRGEPVTVTIAGQEVTCTPQDGRWRVELAPLAEGGPYELSVTQGDDKLSIGNVLVGEVWICCGQSNMKWPLKQSEGGHEAIECAANPRIRLLAVDRKPADQPQSEIADRWTPANTDSVADFSAVGYYFGRALERQLGVPIGLISANEGGTAAEQWMSLEAVEAQPSLRETLKPQNVGKYFNGMIAPLAPYAIRGVIWYQGEQNVSRAYQYRTLVPALIRNWRDTFGQGDFPFLMVQIAPYESIVEEPSDSSWAELRDAQRFVSQTVPMTALAVTVDVGDEKDIHPRRKEPIADRLVLAARALAYGEHLAYSGPSYDRMTVDGDRVTLHFKHVGLGLHAKGGELVGFTVAGEDQRFHPATATIRGDTVIVSSMYVPKPVAVRYGWAAYPVVNLWNRDGLPASPFRTDSFPLTTQDRK